MTDLAGSGGATPSGAGASDPAREVLLEAHSLTKAYGSHLAVDDVSFSIRRSELVGFLGPNGAGKSTTMRMLTGALRPDRGAARLAGCRVDQTGAEGLVARSHLGYLPERTPLYSGMRVDGYLAFVAGLRGLTGAARSQAVQRVVETCSLGGYARRRIRELSKGYRQRVGLAQALMADPDVLVLDEPTSGLDPAEVVRIRELIMELAREKTVLLSTHVLSEIEEVCGRILIIAAGKLVADGTPGELSEGHADLEAAFLARTAGLERRALFGAAEGLA